MADDQPIDLTPTGGILLPELGEERRDALASTDPTDYDAVASLVARWPDLLEGWASLGDVALARGRVVEAYAYFRVGYHRGLDRLRQSGWRGAGRVPLAHEPNRAFLRSTEGLMRTSAAIGDVDEAERCRRLLLDCDPAYPVAVG